MSGKQWQWLRGIPILVVIWLVSAGVDRLWFAVDHATPAWDQAEYLTGSLNYWHALQDPHWFSGEWWTQLWQLSTKMPPLTFMATVPFLNIFGTGPDQSTLVNLLFNAILLIAVYGLGTRLFNVSIGLWAAGLCLLFPGLYTVRLDFLLDYPLVAMVTFSFWWLTLWHYAPRRWQQWATAIAFGFSLGLALMVKQPAVLFLFVPLVWVGGRILWRRQWERLAQLLLSLGCSVLVWGPFYRTNWLLVLSGSKRATIDSAIAEGDPPLHTLDAWIFYWKDLPAMVSWPLLVVPLVGLLLYAGRRWLQGGEVRGSGQEGRSPLFSRSLEQNPTIPQALRWLLIFWLGAYLLSSLNINKDSRYILPYLPVFSLFLAYGLSVLPKQWGGTVRWGILVFSLILLGGNLFPVDNGLLRGATDLFTPRGQHYAYLKQEWPHRQVIDEILQTEPYLQTNLGILPSTPQVNQHNFNYFGALRNFQVYGRQFGRRLPQVSEDARSISWFVLKSDDQGDFKSSSSDAQEALVDTVMQSPEFQVQQRWELEDEGILALYRRKQPYIQVQRNNRTPQQIQLDRITIPPTSPPGVPVPVTYTWSGSWSQLQPGLVILTWKSTDTKNTSHWLHDHGIGLGALHSGQLFPEQRTASFQVVERMAMLPPSDAKPGEYTLEATYFNRQTGETRPIAVPTVTLKIDPKAKASPAPELDWVTQLRSLSQTLPQGRKALDLIFEKVGQINMYDPVQDYLIQAQLALDYRLQQNPQDRDLAYNLALAEVLRQRVQPAIAALKRVVQLDAQNPYAYAYLAFVHLYAWQPKAAQAALQPAQAIAPDLPELKVLNAAAALMRGNLVRAWQDGQAITALSQE